MKQTHICFILKFQGYKIILNIIDQMSNKSDLLLLKIHGKVYDATDFKKRHPGGSVINHYSGTDATDVFDNFHFGSKKAERLLKSLDVVEEKQGMIAPYKKYGKDDNMNREEMLHDFRKWRQSLIDRDFFEPSIRHAIMRTLEMGVYLALGTYFYSIAWPLTGAFLFGMSGKKAGGIQHECLHGSFVKSRKWGKLLGKFFIGFGLSTSGDKWETMHNRHHSSTQKESFDMDLDTMPLVAFYKTSVENVRTNWYSPTWLRYQAFTFIPITSGIFTMIFWILFLHPLNVVKKKLYLEAFFMLSSHMIKTALISYSYGYSILISYSLFWLGNWWAGVLLFSHFSLSHTFLPTVASNEYPTWPEYALRHSVDISTQNPFVNNIMFLLNQQCSHHLFTKMPQFNQPKVSKELEQFAKKWDIPYHHISYFEAWKLLFQNLNDVGKEYYEDANKLMKEE